MRLYTSKVIADWLGLTERRVRQLRDEGIIEEQAPGLYDPVSYTHLTLPTTERV